MKKYQVIELEKPRSAYLPTTETVRLETTDVNEALAYATRLNENFDGITKWCVVNDEDGNQIKHPVTAMSELKEKYGISKDEKEERNLKIAEKALDQVITDFKVTHEDFKDENMQAAKDYMDIEDEYQEDETTLEKRYYDWFKSSVVNYEE